jgi:putative transcriptional regulator
MKSAGTSKKRAETSANWSQFDAMTDEQRSAAALSDPDAQPMRPTKHGKPRSRAFIIRRALGLSQEGFAERYRIPVGTLRDWEQGRSEPDQATRAYLIVIAKHPDEVAKALAAA